MTDNLSYRDTKAEVSFVCPICYTTTTFNLYQSYGYFCSKCKFDFSSGLSCGTVAVDERTGEYGA